MKISGEDKCLVRLKVVLQSKCIIYA
jgi:hypothetical protein